MNIKDVQECLQDDLLLARPHEVYPMQIFLSRDQARASIYMYS